MQQHTGTSESTPRKLMRDTMSVAKHLPSRTGGSPSWESHTVDSYVVGGGGGCSGVTSGVNLMRVDLATESLVE